ncbi:MAG: hypothetical protein OEX07_13045 [Gammaproteobacteria bacterium]|nr:hypothetical protein [Gammaproteobacteria bacterium]
MRGVKRSVKQDAKEDNLHFRKPDSFEDNEVIKIAEVIAEKRTKNRTVKKAVKISKKRDVCI